ncbi:DUF5013 domain-containing protein [Pedobacter sp. SYSU D00535]|uniref:DUF5013 domain-containing protein n=1 Tax=Pedobacter sp. SYSU D00535 TaxID=2810308 RepID=UPI001A96A2F2|nr:DUF5013 domain-containing protein [Pedobacter sp. SYSU D00535]
MKFNNIISIKFFLSIVLLLSLGACSKDDPKLEYGFSKVYMPQAINKSGGVNNQYPVPSGTDSSTYNYVLKESESKINVVLGAALSGPGAEAYSVDVSVDNDTIQELFANNTFDPARYKLMPASMYTLPSRLEVPKGSKAATFYLGIDISQLKSNTYAGKYLLLAVKVSNPSNYELNSALSTTLVVLDVDALVIGPAVNITSKYILNPGDPFIATARNGKWGTLKDWVASPGALSHGGVGGFVQDGDGMTMNMESGWGSPLISNGKIYQTITLPPGTYSFDPSGGAWKWQGTKDPAYAVVALNADVLPDYSNIVNNTSIVYQRIAQPQPHVTFKLTATTKVTVGVVVNYVQNEQGFKSTKVSLFSYPKHL